MNDAGNRRIQRRRGKSKPACAAGVLTASIFDPNAPHDSANVARITPYNKDMGLNLRAAEAADVGRILTFIRALATYEREPDAVSATEDDLLRHGFGPNPYFQCLLAEWDGEAVGFALYFYDYSTWLGRPGLYLEDIFVDPPFRGLGIGKALLRRLAAIALENGCARMKWEVLDWNTPAIDFYRALGAELQQEWLNVRLSGEALRRLADPGELSAPVQSQEKALSGEAAP